MNVNKIVIWRNAYTNVISINPLESDPNKIEPMKLIQLSKKAGFKYYILRKKKFKYLLREYSIEGMPVFSFMEGETTKVLVNPHIYKPFNRGSEKALKILFNKEAATHE